MRNFMTIVGTLVFGLCTLTAEAVQSPPGCNANTLALTMSRDKSVASPGEIVTFGVNIAVPAFDVGGVPACDVSNVTVRAQCPDAGNNIPPTTPVQVLLTGGAFPAGTPPTSVGSIACAMPVVPVLSVVSAYSQMAGLLLDTDIIPGSPFARDNSITVLVTPCSVKVNKEVSCDGGATWVDPGLVTNNEDGTLSCAAIGLNAPIMVRWQAANTSASCALDSCVFTDTNGAFGAPPTGVNIPPNSTTPFFPAPVSPACGTAFGSPESPHEPNTVRVTCQTGGGTPVSASDSAAFQCLSVDLLVDRNVNCGPGPVDQTLVRANEDGTNGCTAIDGDPVAFAYQAKNNGTAPLYACQLTDNNLLVSAPINVGTLAPGQLLPNIPATHSPVACGNALEASEVPDQGRVDLTCCSTAVGSLVDCPVPNRVSVHDVSTVRCLTPAGLDVQKLCVDTNLDGTDDNVRVIASAGAGDFGFVNCVARDILHLDDDCNSTNTLEVPLTLEVPGPFDLGPLGSRALFGTITPALEAKACNTASVTCSLANNPAISRTAVAAPVECNVREAQGCITRTPGFWGTHTGEPETQTGAADFLPVEVCGRTIDNAEAGNDHSSTEAICSVGRDGHILGPQLTQLVRQCTAAALNIAASTANGGNCEADSNIGSVMDSCCDAVSACTGDASNLSVEQCIGLLDNFNNSEDTLESPAFQHPGRANPRACQDSKGDGIVVTPQ
jgi:hypothetical protein